MTAFHRSTEWQALAKEMRPILQRAIDAGMGVCIDCGGAVLPGERWQVGHRLSRREYPHLALMPWNLGPSHGGKGGRRQCNQQAGGRLGNKIMRANRARRTGMIRL